MIRMGLIALISLSISAFAENKAGDVSPYTLQDQKLKFGYSSFHNFYACSLVKRQTETILEHLGAQNTKVRCTGGIRDGFVFVRAKFQSPKVLKGNDVKDDSPKGLWTKDSLRFSKRCDLTKTILDSVLPKFPVSSLERKGFCDGSRGRLSYDLLVLKPQK